MYDICFHLLSCLNIISALMKTSNLTSPGGQCSSAQSPSKPVIPTATVTSDASGGCGAFYEAQWFQLAWDHCTAANYPKGTGPNSSCTSHMGWFLAEPKCKMPHRRCLHSENEDVQKQGGDTRIHFFETHYSWGAHNDWADDLSRNRCFVFCRKNLRHSI